MGDSAWGGLKISLDGGDADVAGTLEICKEVERNGEGEWDNYCYKGNRIPGWRVV